MKLYPFQETGVTFLAQRDRAYLADRMGLGKTVQAAQAAKVVRPRSVLVVAKAAALENWAREWQIWGPDYPHTVAFVSWAQVHKHTDSRRDLVILDEAHFAKNGAARRAQAALKIAAFSGRAWLLSGTPMPNHPGELYAPLAALWPEELAKLGIETEWQWIKRYCRFTPTQWGIKVYGTSDRIGEIRGLLRRTMLRRTLNDVGIQLPPIRLDVYRLPQNEELDRAVADLGLDPAAMKQRMDYEAMSAWGSDARLRRLLGEYKAPWVAQLLGEELEAREYGKVVVFAWHRSVLAVLAKALAPYGVVGFDGSTPAAQRQAIIDEFTYDPSARVFLGQQQAAGDSINLQVASEVVLVEPSWSPDDNAQAIKRCHRIGSKHPVRARIFAINRTVDERVIEAIAGKTRMQLEVGL